MSESKTGIELLKEKMHELGASKLQIESKAVSYVLAALSDNEDWIKNYDLAKEIETNSECIVIQKRRLEDCKRELDSLKQRSFELKVDISKALNFKQKECIEYIEKFTEELKKCETEEGRDRMRAAQVFVNSVDVDTKYDNTAFIVGLASLLAGTKLNTVDEIVKINKKLFQTPVRPLQEGRR